jgi:hypothetical protein
VPFSPLQVLKQPPGQASPAAILCLIEKLKQIEATGILAVNLPWLNNNYQRALAHYVRRCSAARLRQLQLSRRYAVLIYFLWQTYRDTIDYIVDMHDKILTGVYSRAQEAIDEETRRRRTLLQTSLRTYRTLGAIVLDESISDVEIRHSFFSQIKKVSKSIKTLQPEQRIENDSHTQPKAHLNANACQSSSRACR